MPLPAWRTKYRIPKKYFDPVAHRPDTITLREDPDELQAIDATDLARIKAESRIRMQTSAEAWQRGTHPPLLCTSLCGPFDQNFVNPWAPGANKRKRKWVIEDDDHSAIVREAVDGTRKILKTDSYQRSQRVIEATPPPPTSRVQTSLTRIQCEPVVQQSPQEKVQSWLRRSDNIIGHVSSASPEPSPSKHSSPPPSATTRFYRQHTPSQQNITVASQNMRAPIPRLLPMNSSFETIIPLHQTASQPGDTHSRLQNALLTQQTDEGVDMTHSQHTDTVVRAEDAIMAIRRSSSPSQSEHTETSVSEHTTFSDEDVQAGVELKSVSDHLEECERPHDTIEEQSHSGHTVESQEERSEKTSLSEDGEVAALKETTSETSLPPSAQIVPAMHTSASNLSSALLLSTINMEQVPQQQSENSINPVTVQDKTQEALEELEQHISKTTSFVLPSIPPSTAPSQLRRSAKRVNESAATTRSIKDALKVQKPNLKSPQKSVEKTSTAPQIPNTTPLAAEVSQSQDQLPIQPVPSLPSTSTRGSLRRSMLDLSPIAASRSKRGNTNSQQLDAQIDNVLDGEMDLDAHCEDVQAYLSTWTSEKDALSL